MNLTYKRVAIGIAVVLVVMLLYTFFTPLTLAGGIVKVVVGMAVSAVVGVVVGAITLNPGAGMAVAMMTCVLICSPGNDGKPNRRPVPPSSFIPAPPPSSVTPTPAPAPTPAPMPSSQPFASLSRCNVTTDPNDCSDSSSGWGTGNMSIITGHEIKLRWNSSNATNCSGTLFTTGGATSNTAGVSPSVAATPSSPREYVLACDDNDPSTQPGISRVEVTANDAMPILAATPGTVKINQPFTLFWDLNGNNPDTCSFTTGADAPTDVVNETSKILTAEGSSTYTLTCAGGTTNFTIQVIPQVYES